MTVRLVSNKQLLLNATIAAHTVLRLPCLLRLAAAELRAWKTSAVFAADHLDHVMA